MCLAFFGLITPQKRSYKLFLSTSLLSVSEIVLKKKQCYFKPYLYKFVSFESSLSMSISTCLVHHSKPSVLITNCSYNKKIQSVYIENTSVIPV